MPTRFAPNYTRVSFATLLAVASAGCADDPAGVPAAFEELAPDAASAAPPAPLALIPVPGGTATIWPYTGANFSEKVDPINLVFVGAEPLEIRAALVSLGPNRAPTFPQQPPFDCVWRDAVGGMQTGYDVSNGWSGSAIQLECGAFGPIRFHVRLFGGGGLTLGNAHFEVLVPGTSTHEVLSWELAETFVMADMLRGGFLDAAAPLWSSGLINEAPTYRVIRAPIYNGLPDELIGLLASLGAPAPAKPVATDVPVPSDGRATVFNVAQTPAIVPGTFDTDFTVAFGQVIPKPFCGGPADFVYVEGSVHVRQRVKIAASSSYHLEYDAAGDLKVTPVNPLTMPPTPIGPTLDAQVIEAANATINPGSTFLEATRYHTVLPTDGPGGGELNETLKVGAGAEQAESIERCGS